MSFKSRITSRYGPEVLDMLKELEKLLEKNALNANHLTFLMKCKQNNLIPKGLRLKSPLKDQRSKSIAKEASFKLLRNKIYHVRLAKFLNGSKIEQLLTKLNEEIGNDNLKPILTSLNAKSRRIFNAKKNKQKIKFKKLVDFMTLERNSAGSVTGCDKATTATVADTDKTVINLSSRDLDNVERQVLSKGLNFGIAPSRVSNVNIVTSVEPATSFLPVNNRDSYRCDIVNIMKRPIKINHNLTKTENLTINNLKKDDSIVIVPSDKGGAVVVMDRDQYKTKLNEIINGGQYRQLARDPTNIVQNKIKHALKNIKTYVNESTFFRLSPQFSKPPHLYGLPKLHKEGVPLRPIVSAIGSPYYELSRFLLPILNPLYGKSTSFIKNSVDFVEKLSLHPPTDITTMVSFDVTNLFPSVPIELCLTTVRTLLENDLTLSERTKIPIATILELLSVCVKSNYFQVDDMYFEQTKGMAMGGVLSPILCNLFMEKFETDALNSADVKPRIWLRYVDDVFCLWEGTMADLLKFKDHLNSLVESIKFTVELENERKLPFLDVLVEKNCDSWCTSVYRKPTSTGQYLNYNSNHPAHVKLGLVIGLVNRAKSICSSEELFNNELGQIKTHLKNSGYPPNIVNKALNHINNKEKSIDVVPKERPLTTVAIPYVRNFSEKIRRLNSKHNIRTVFKTNDTIRSRITKVKPVNKQQETKNVVYEVPCSCKKSYIGQTSRPVIVRLNEHKKKVNSREIYGSKISEHVVETNHEIKWEDSRILLREPDWRRRNLAESLFIAANKDSLSHPSIDISPVYLDIVRDELQTIQERAMTVDFPLQISRAPAPSTPPGNQEPDIVVSACRRSARLREARATKLSQLPDEAGRLPRSRETLD